MRKNSSSRFLVVLFLALLIPVLSIINTVFQNHSFVDINILAMRKTIRQEQHIIHAGGYLLTHDGQSVSYTNSYDALIHMYEAGNRICEIDIRETTDGVLICAHGDSTHLAQGSELPVSASSDEFMSEKLFGEFQPMTVRDLTDFMRKHRDLIIITDVKDDNIKICKMIAEQYPDLKEQFIIQIYHFSEYDAIQESGFPYLIYTAYQAYPEERSVWSMAQFAKTHELVGFTVERSFFKNTLTLRLAHLVTGVPFMLHTINDYAEIDQILRSKLAIGIYTDQTDFSGISFTG